MNEIYLITDEQRDRMTMQKNQIVKMLILNISIAAVNVFVFSDGLMDLDFGDSPMDTALIVAVVFVSLGVFGYGNYALLGNQPKSKSLMNPETSEDCILTLRNNRVKTFTKETETILLQTDRFTSKKVTINDILMQKFDPGEMSFNKFDGAVNEVEKVFYMNIKSILNRLNAFDEGDYLLIRRPSAAKKFSESFIQSKLAIYQEYIDFVKEAIEDNEEILLKLDKLLLEISKFNSLEDGEVENMSAMKEIDELINKTKYYK